MRLVKWAYFSLVRGRQLQCITMPTILANRPKLKNYPTRPDCSDRQKQKIPFRHSEFFGTVPKKDPCAGTGPEIYARFVCACLQTQQTFVYRSERSKRKQKKSTSAQSASAQCGFFHLSENHQTSTTKGQFIVRISFIIIYLS